MDLPANQIDLTWQDLFKNISLKPAALNDLVITPETIPIIFVPAAVAPAPHVCKLSGVAHEPAMKDSVAQAFIVKALEKLCHDKVYRHFGKPIPPE